MKGRIQIVGGPRDGDSVPDYGPVYREPVPIRSSVRIPLSAQVPAAFELEVQHQKPFDERIYDRKQWFNGAKVEPRYLLRGCELDR